MAQSKRKARQQQPDLLGRLAAALACQILAGCLPAPGADNAFYLLLPYAAALVCTALAAFSWHQMGHPTPTRPGRTAPDHHANLLRRLLVASVACGLTAAGELLYVVLNGAAESFGLTGSPSWGPGALWATAYAALLVGAGALLWRLREHLA